MKLLFLLFLIFTFNLKAQTLDSIENEKIFFEIESIVEKTNKWWRCRCKTFEVNEVIKETTFTKMEICKKRNIQKYRYSNNEDNGINIKIIEIIISKGELSSRT